MIRQFEEISVDNMPTTLWDTDTGKLIGLKAMFQGNETFFGRVIPCKDCKHARAYPWHCNRTLQEVDAYDYCSKAERNGG